MVNISNFSISNISNEAQGLIQMPPAVDYSFRGLCFLIHAVYFVIVMFCKDLQKISLIHMHHTNLIGLLTGLHYSIWIAWVQPATPYPELNTILCTISDAFWAISKYARCYSILILAAYRIVAVFYINAFKKLVSSMAMYVLGIFFVWFVSGIIFMIAKLTGHTQPGIIICYDGYSPYLINSLIYYVITSTLGYVLPTSLIVVAYVLIRNRLNKLSGRVSVTSKTSRLAHGEQSACDSGIAVGGSGTSRHNVNPNNTTTLHGSMQGGGLSSSTTRKERKLAKQFIVINLFEIGSCVFLVLLSSTNVITIFSFKYYYFRQLFRIGNLVCQSIIPVVSLIYSPVFKRFKSVISCF